MMLLLAVLLQQAPVLTEAAASDPGGRVRTALAVSPSGKYLVIAEADRLQIRNGETLELVKEIATRWTAFSFDEDEARFLVVGNDVALYLSRDWSPQFRVSLEDAKFAEESRVFRLDPDGEAPLKPGQAFILSDLDFYYRTRKGEVALGSVVDKKLESKTVALASEDSVDRILNMSSTALFVALKDGRPGVAQRSRLNYLMGCPDVFLATAVDTAAVCVGAKNEALYSITSWKVVASRQNMSNLCAGVDAARGWVFAGDSKGLRGWSLKQFDAPVRFEQFSGPVTRLAVGAGSLYTLQDNTVRRWTLKD